MIRVYADAETGRLAYLFEADHGDETLPEPAPGFVAITFDETTNRDVVDGLGTAWAEHAIVGGQLVRNGQPVAIAADGEAAQDAREMAQVIDAIRTYLAATGNQRTDAQRMAFERNVGRVLRHLVRRLA